MQLMHILYTITITYGHINNTFSSFSYVFVYIMIVVLANYNCSALTICLRFVMPDMRCDENHTFGDTILQIACNATIYLL